MAVGNVNVIWVLLGWPVNSAPRVPLDPNAKVGYPCPVPPSPNSLGLSAHLYPPACPSLQPAAACHMAAVMRALGALVPASVMKGGLGHTVRCSWVSVRGVCAHAAYTCTLPQGYTQWGGLRVARTGGHQERSC